MKQLSGRRIFCSLAGVALLVCLVSADSEAPVATFVHLSDTHLMDLHAADPKVANLRRPALPATGAFAPLLLRLSRMSRPEFIIHSGDIADGFSFENPAGKPVYGQIEFAQEAFARSPIPIYSVLGNHDLSHYTWNAARTDVAPDQSVAGAARAHWISQMPSFRNGTYYSWERAVGRAKYLFLMLDNGYHAGTPLDESKESRRFRLSDEQQQWLRSQVQSHPDYQLMLVMHVPLGNDEMSASVKAALAGHREAIFAFAGHTHTVDAVEEIDLGAGRTLHQIRTKGFVLSENHWRQVKMYEDRVEIFQMGSVDQIRKTFALAGGQELEAQNPKSDVRSR